MNTLMLPSAPVKGGAEAERQTPDADTAWVLDRTDNTLYAQGDSVIRLPSGWTCTQDSTHACDDRASEWSMVSFALIEQAFAVIGLTDKFNSTGGFVSRQWTGSTCEVLMRDGGPWLAWSQHPPVSMHADEEPLDFEHYPITGRLECVLPASGQKTLRLTW